MLRTTDLVPAVVAYSETINDQYHNNSFEWKTLSRNAIYLIWWDVRVWGKRQHAHHLPYLIQLPSFCLAEVFACMSKRDSFLFNNTNYDFWSIFTFNNKYSNPDTLVSYLTASIRLFCRMSSINSWILKLNSKQLWEQGHISIKLDQLYLSNCIVFRLRDKTSLKWKHRLQGIFPQTHSGSVTMVKTQVNDWIQQPGEKRTQLNPASYFHFP